MGRRWVLNASPIIVLAKIGQLSLLDALCAEMVVPAAVADEIRSGVKTDPARAWLEGEGTLHVRPIQSLDPVITAWDLGIGESEVLTWARANAGYEAILDDRVARRCALSLRVPVRGTLGVILLAKREAIVPVAKPVFQEMLKVGFRIDAEVLAAVLRLAGE